MKKETDIRQGRHCVFSMHVHLAFVTKYRRQLFDQEAIQRLREVFNDVCLDFEAQLIETEGEAEQVHLLVNYPPKIALSTLVNRLKGVSRPILRRDRQGIAKRYYYKRVLGSPSYFASSGGGAPIEIIRQWIEPQQKPL